MRAGSSTSVPHLAGRRAAGPRVDYVCMYYACNKRGENDEVCRYAMCSLPRHTAAYGLQILYPIQVSPAATLPSNSTRRPESLKTHPLRFVAKGATGDYRRQHASLHKPQWFRGLEGALCLEEDPPTIPTYNPLHPGGALCPSIPKIAITETFVRGTLQA